MHTQAIFAAMLYGDLSRLSPETHFLFAQAGLAHILCASGLHLCFAAFFAQAFGNSILWCLQKLLYPWIRQFPKLLLYQSFFPQIFVLIFCSYFATKCNWSAPITRAYIVVVFYLIAKCLQLKWQWIFLFCIAIFISYCLHPHSNLSISLSAFAVLSLYYAQIRRYQYKWQKILAYSFYPFCFTMPIIVSHFHMIATYSVLLNLLFSPLIWLFYAFAFSSLLLDFLSLPNQFFLQFCYTCIEYFMQILQQLRQLPIYSLWVNPTNFFLCKLLLITAFVLYKISKRIHYSLPFLTSLLYFLYANNANNLQNEAIFLDVGQGDSIFLKSFSSDSAKKNIFRKNERSNKEFITTQTALIDFGARSKNPFPSRSAQRLAALQINKLDHLILTHPDQDHFGGLHSILLRFPIQANLWLNPDHLLFEKIYSILALAEQYQIPIRFIQQTREILPDLHCRSPIDFYLRSSNNSSILCKFTFSNQQSLLLTGDIDKKLEKRLSENTKTFLQADYLKLAHHGSNTSSSAIFLDTVNPTVALISAAKKNSYRHPHPKVLQRVNKRKIQILQTAVDGNIKLPL